MHRTAAGFPARIYSPLRAGCPVTASAAGLVVGDSFVEGAVGHAVALAAGLPGGLFFSFTQVADFALEFDEAFMPFARERAVGDGGEHGAVLLLRVRAIAEMAAGRQHFDFGKRFLRAIACSPEVKFPHAGRVNDHAALRQKNHLAP